MRIALLTDGISPYVIGGMQKHSFNLVKYFAANKVFVDLYHTNRSEYDISKLEFFLDDEKKYIRSFVIDFPSLGNFPGHYIRESFEYSSNIFKVFSENNKVDFVYAKGFSAWKLIDEKRKGYKCAPIGVNFHGYEMFQKAASLKSWLEQKVLLCNPVMYNIKNANYIFSYGGRITELILKLGIQKERIIESPAGIEGEWIVANNKQTNTLRKFVFVGRYERRKGIQEINIVLQDLVKDYNFEFHFVGDIPENCKLHFAQVKYWGKMTDESKLKDIILNCDVLVCPSYSEGMPNVILEAMALGLSVIATDVGAVNTMVNLTTGWLIKPGKTMELKNAIINAISMPAHDLDVLRKNSLTHVRNDFLLNEVMVKLLNNISLLSQQNKNYICND